MSTEWIKLELKSCSKQLSASVGKQIQTEFKKSADLLMSDVEGTKQQAAFFVKLVGEITEHLSSLAQKETGEFEKHFSFPGHLVLQSLALYYPTASNHRLVTNLRYFCSNIWSKLRIIIYWAISDNTRCRDPTEVPSETSNKPEAGVSQYKGVCQQVQERTGRLSKLQVKSGDVGR